jgi:hypothetical protein
MLGWRLAMATRLLAIAHRDIAIDSTTHSILHSFDYDSLDYSSFD